MLVEELNLKEFHLALAQRRFGRLACARDNQPSVVPIYFAVDEAYEESRPGLRRYDWKRLRGQRS